MTSTYKKAGVDIDEGNRFVDKIKPFIRATHRLGVIGDVGGFGGFFALEPTAFKEPVLVSGTDGVGTKLRIAIDLERYDTIGQDLVAMCVNDIACSGAEPLFFLDYFATGKLDADAHTSIVAGIAKACQQTRCALIGGETAEMPDMYEGKDFDLAGFAVGIVERKEIIDGSDIGQGYAIVGLASSGFHSNGYSLVRHIVKERNLDLGKTYSDMEKPLGEMLLTPTKLYSPLIGKLKRIFTIKGIAHITGGGFWDNIPRILPTGVQAAITRGSWPISPLFSFFQREGQVADDEMLRVFNCGVGMILIVPQDQARELITAIVGAGEEAWLIGQTRIRPKDGPAIIIE